MCLPWTWIIAVYMQLCLLLSVTFCFLCGGLILQMICVGCHVIIFFVSFIVKILETNKVVDLMVETGNSTSGILRPSRNIFMFARWYILPFEYYNSFFLFGVIPGYIFFCYLEREIIEESIQYRPSQAPENGDHRYNPHFGNFGLFRRQLVSISS